MPKPKSEVLLLNAGLLERGRDPNEALASIDITPVVAITKAIMLIVMGEFCGG